MYINNKVPLGDKFIHMSFRLKVQYYFIHYKHDYQPRKVTEMEESEVTIVSVMFVNARYDGGNIEMNGKPELDFAKNPFSLITLRIEFQTFVAITGKMFIRVSHGGVPIKDSAAKELSLTPGTHPVLGYIDDIDFRSPDVYELAFFLNDVAVEQQFPGQPARLTLT